MELDDAALMVYKHLSVSYGRNVAENYKQVILFSGKEKTKKQKLNEQNLIAKTAKCKDDKLSDAKKNIYPLVQGEMTVQQLAKIVNRSEKIVRDRLLNLKDIGWVAEERRKGKLNATTGYWRAM